MKNLKITQLLYLSFGVTIFFTIILGIVGALFTNNTNQQYVDTVTPCTKALDYLTDTWLYYDDLKYYTSLGINLMEYNKEDIALKEIDEYFSHIEQNIKKFDEISKNINFNDETLNSLEIIKNDLRTLLNTQSELVSAIKNGNKNKALEIIYELASGDLTNELEDNLDAVYYSISDLNIKQTEMCTKNSYICIIAIIVLLLIALAIGIFLSIYITKMLKNEIHKIMSAAKEVANGNLSVSLQSEYHNELGDLTNSISNIVSTFRFILDDINNSADEIEKGSIHSKISSDNYKGDYKKVIDAINHTTELLIEDLLSAVNTMSDYADGNFNNKIKRFNGEKAIIHKKLDKVQENLISITKDIEKLIKSVLKGNLNTHIDSVNYNGDWKNIAESFNKLMVAVSQPVSEVSKILSLVSQANFSGKVTGDYNGEFLCMKQSVNKTIENNSNYINEISDVLTEMSNNNLDIEIKRDYAGDYSSIKTAIDKIIFSFNKVLADISKSSEDIMIGSKHIAQSSITIADGASSQATSVENLTTTVKDIFERVTNNNETMKETNLFTLNTKEKAFDSKLKMDNLFNSINDINEASEKILSIINVIDDIAFQTNILAINAAIEAARAGSAGKGFAVVAEEVGNLAARSQIAVQNTHDLIKNVVNKVETGTNIAVSTMSMLDDVVKDVEKISGVLLNSADSSQKALEAVESISTEINMINEITQKNSASSQVAAAASEELASQSEVFNKTLQAFKIKKNISIA